MSPIVPSIGTRMGSGWGRVLRQGTIEGERVADVLAQQVRFRVIRSGAQTIQDVRPDSAAARRLWERPETRQFAQGVLNLANDVSSDLTHATPLRGFTLATSDAGYVVNRAVHHMRSGTAPSADALAAALDAAAAHTSGTNAVRKGAWLHLGPGRSAGMLHMLEHPGTQLRELTPELRTSLGRGVKTLLHELNHVSSPRPAHAQQWDWLSEGIAETLARWPGRVPAAGRELGMDVPRGVGRGFDRRGGPYQEEVAAVRGLLRLSGIDTRRSAAFAEAERLLNGPGEDALAGVLATRIASRHATNAAEQQQLARMIEQRIGTISADGSNADPAVVRRLAAELSSR